MDQFDATSIDLTVMDGYAVISHATSLEVDCMFQSMYDSFSMG
jgi:hypothetical protein